MNQLARVLREEIQLEAILGKELAKESVDPNPVGGSFPIRIPKGATVLRPEDKKSVGMVTFVARNGNVDTSLYDPRERPVPSGAESVYFPDFHCEDIGGTGYVHYGEPVFIPPGHVRVMQPFHYEGRKLS